MIFSVQSAIQIFDIIYFIVVHYYFFLLITFPIILLFLRFKYFSITFNTVIIIIIIFLLLTKISVITDNKIFGITVTNFQGGNVIPYFSEILL